MALPFLPPTGRPPLPGPPPGMAMGLPSGQPTPPLGTIPPPPGSPLGAVPPEALPPPPPPMGLPPMATQPGPPGLFGPPPPPPPDPDQTLTEDALSDPMLLASLLFAPNLQKNKAPVGPVYPTWYQPPPKPSSAKMMMLANADYDAHRDLIARMEEDYSRIHLKSSAVFSRDQRTRDPFVSTGMANEVNLVANMVGGIPLVHEIQYGTEELSDKAQQLEDFLDWCREDAIRQYIGVNGGVLARDEAMSMLTYGRCCWRFAISFEDPERPILAHLLDPATVFPTWDGHRGLERVTRRYRDTIANVIGLHDPVGTGGLRLKIEQAAGARSDDYGYGAGEIRGLQDHDLVDVIEYWDRKWYGVLVAGAEVNTVAHNYGFVPFSIQLTPLGAPGFTVGAGEFRDVRGMTVPSGRRPLRDIGVSHIHYLKHTHNIIESVHTRGLMEIMKSANPPVIRYQSKEAAETGLKEADTSEGAVNPALLGEEQIQVWPTAPAPHVFGPVLNQVARDISTGMMPLASFGVNENSNVSGHALENLEDSGRDKMAPTVMALELGHQRNAEMLLRMFADWGDFIGHDGNRGAFPVFRAEPAPGEPPMFELTPETVRQVGIRVRCSLRHVRLESLAPLFNAAQIGVNLGMMTTEDVLRARGIRDVKRYQRKWEEEKLRRDALDHPKAKEYAIYKMFSASTDPEDRDFAQWWSDNVLSAEQNQPQPDMMGGGQMPPGVPPGMPGGMPPGMMGPNTTAGVNLANYGMPVGPGSGPGGPLGPRAGGGGITIPQVR